MRRFFRPVSALAAATMLLAAFSSSAFADPRDFELVNSSSVVLTHAFVSASDVNSWEEDILGRDVLNSGESTTISFAQFDGETCLYDIKVLGQEGQEGYLYKVDLCSISTVSFTD